MLQQEYTEKEEKLFTGRISYIRQLKESISKKNIIAVLGPSGLGRTAIMRQFASKNSAFYIDLRRLSISPENFSQELISALCFFALSKSNTEAAYDDYSSIEKLKQLKLGKRCSEIIATVDNELQKIKPDQVLLLRSAFSFAEQLAAEKETKFTVILNNFDELLKLNNFPMVKDALSIFFGSVSKNKGCSFILSSGAVNLMRQHLKKFTEDIIDIKPFSQDETAELFEKVAGKSDERIIKEVHSSSAGIPIIITRIASRFRQEKSSDTQHNIAMIRRILLSELCTTSSTSYFYCSKLFTESLNRARGEALLKSILKVVSQNKPLRLTEIARLVYRSGPVTKSLLERLVEVDLIAKTENTFDFANPALKLWCRLYFSGIEFKTSPDEKTIEEIERRL